MSSPRGHRFFLSIVLLGSSMVVAAILAEVFLRVVPIPGVTYHTFYFDDVTGLRYYPHTTYIYRNERGTHVRRRVNSWGYLDVEHRVAKPNGVVRVGFFGDSFTEAHQVPQADTFERRIERGLNAEGTPNRFECIAIGMSGYGTTQSYLECRRWMRKLALDRVVYVFCENDPGNNVPLLNHSDQVPYPVLAGDSLSIDNSFVVRHANKRRWPHRTWQYLKSHSLLFSTLETRVRLLRSRGVRLHVDEAERAMQAPTRGAATLSANSPPSELPDTLRTRCETVTEHVILTWKQVVEDAGATFSILYLPRGAVMAEPQAQQDSWAPWLIPFCHAHGIKLIDPTTRFVRAENNGVEIYYDHLTSQGHAEMAAAFLEQAAFLRGVHPSRGMPDAN